MFSWKVLWSTVLILAVKPAFFAAKAVIRASYAALGLASEPFEPKLTTPLAAVLPPPPVDPVAGVLLLPQAARSGGVASSAPAPRAPRSRERRLTCWFRTEGGTRLARYSAWVVGRDIHVSYSRG